MTDPREARARSGVRKAFRRVAPEIDIDRIDPRLDLREEADLDSVDAINLIVGIHEELGVDIPEGDYDEVATLGDMIRYVAERIGPEG